MPEARHADSGEVCSRETYLKRAWCRAEILAFFVRRGPAFMYFLNSPDADLEPMLPSAEGLPENFLELVDVFHGEMTCCKMGHNNGTTPCDREKLVKPMMGLLVELYRDRHEDAAARTIWDAIEPNLQQLYPKTFDYACGPGGRTERRALFGDLVTAMLATGAHIKILRRPIASTSTPSTLRLLNGAHTGTTTSRTTATRPCRTLRRARRRCCRHGSGARRTRRRRGVRRRCGRL